MPTPRRAARVVLLDGDDRVLLLKVVNRARGVAYWVTAGGGLNQGESDAEAAGRELAEETGMRGADVGPPLWRNHRHFRLNGEVFAQEEVFLLGRTPTVEVNMSGLDEWEKLTHHRAGGVTGAACHPANTIRGCLRSDLSRVCATCCLPRWPPGRACSRRLPNCRNSAASPPS